MLHKVKPITTVVVELGTVYKVSGVPAELLIAVWVTVLNVFAISYPNAIANAVASSSEAAPVVIPKLVGVIFFIVPPSSIKTKSASLLDVVVVGVSELPVVNTVPDASGKFIFLLAVGVVEGLSEQQNLLN